MRALRPGASVHALRMNCSRGNSDQYRSSHRAPNLKTSDVSDTHGSAMDTKKMSGVSRAIIGLIVIPFSFSEVLPCHILMLEKPVVLESGSHPCPALGSAMRLLVQLAHSLPTFLMFIGRVGTSHSAFQGCVCKDLHFFHLRRNRK